ncbi:MAG: hypothetical protein ACP5JR_06950, partial [Thermoplasmata archaeon]
MAEKSTNEIFTEILLRVKPDMEIPLLIDALGRYKRKYKELAKIGVTPDFEITMSGPIRDPEETFTGFLYALYECAKEKSGVEKARNTLSEVLEHVIATTENPVFVRVAKEFLSKIRMERSPTEELAERLLQYKLEGYPVDRVIVEKEKGIEAFRKAYEEFVAKVEKLKLIESQIKDMDTEGFEEEVKEIRENLKRPDKLERIEELIAKIIAGRSLEKIEKELETVSRELDRLEAQVIRKPKPLPAPYTLPREGKVNGRKEGRINGRITGKINGTVEKGAKKEREDGKKAAVAIVVFLLLLIPPMYILFYSPEKMKIDGDLSDWADKAAIEQNPAGMG